MKSNTQIFSRTDATVVHSILLVENLYTITYEGSQVCLKQEYQTRLTPSYRFFLYSNVNIATKKMSELNTLYQTTGFRVERINNTEEVCREHIKNDLSTNKITYIKTQQGWQQQ